VWKKSGLWKAWQGQNVSVNALWLVLGILFAAVVFGVLTYIGRRWRP
jgi:hypothetical protein